MTFFQGNLEKTGIYFQFYPTESNSPVPLLWYIGGDYGKGSVIRAMDFAGPLNWDADASAFKPKNAKSYTKNFNLLVMDFPCTYGFKWMNFDCPLADPKDLDA